MLGRLLFFIMFTVTVAILIVPVILTILFWVITNRGLMWIVKMIDFVLKLMGLDENGLPINKGNYGKINK